MGCSSSVEMSPNRSGGYQGKAYPQQQQPQQQPPSQRQHQNQQPAKGYMTVVNNQSPQQQPQQQQRQQLAASKAASPGQSGFTQDYDVEKTEIAVKDITPSKDLLQKYIDLDNEIRKMESTNVLKTYTDLNAANQALKEVIGKLEVAHQEAKNKTAKEKGEYDDMFTAWSANCGDEDESGNAELSKEKKEWLEAMGEEEVAKKELDGVREKLTKNEESLKASSVSMEELKKKHKEQEELLAAIFKGAYGSDLENRLEAESDFLDDRKHRVGAAKYKWSNGRNLLSHATAQLCLACKKWMSLPQINPQDKQGKWVVATEARNNVVAACQNITSARRYLSTIEFPYCKPPEVKVLETAASHVYTDMLSQQRHQYVYANVYHIMYKRCKALIDWFTHVLTETIAKDLAEATTAANAKAQELRQERLNLISVKIKEELQQDVSFEARAEDLADDSTSVTEDESQVFQAEGGEGEDKSGEEPPAADVDADEPFNPVPLKELVQTPNKEDLFGDAQELYKKHQENLEELEKNRMINKARQEQGLEEKLRARRSRRQRQEAVANEQQLQQA